MSETRARGLFAEAADDLAIGPPPDLTVFTGARRSRGRLAALSVTAVATAAATVVVGVSLLGASPRHDAAGSPVTPYPTTGGSVTLDCRTDRRSVGTWEATAPVRRTPLALGTLFTNPIANERAVVWSVEGRSARVVLLRGDSTAWAVLTLRYDAATGWALERTTSCPSRYVRMYHQHQPQVRPGS